MRAERAYRRAEQTRAAVRPALGKVVGSLLLAVIAGAAIGLLVPINGRSALPRLGHAAGLNLPDFAWPRMPWQTADATDPELAALVRERGFFPPPPLGAPRRPTALGTGRLPRRADAPPPASVFHRLAFPNLGPDRLALPLYAELRRYDLRQRPAGIDPVARLAHVPVLMYHDVVAGEKGVWFDLDLAEFERDLALLAEQGVQPISLRQWWAYITQGAPLPPKPVLLTFDDGYSSVYDLIYPRLKAREWPAVFFIVTSTVGRVTGKDHLTWDQMREMQATGLFEFQAHSVTHPLLTEISERAMVAEIRDCQRTLEAELGVPIQYFCYPVGDRNERVIQALKSAGFIAGFTMTAGGSAQSPGMMEINRYPSQEIESAVEAANGSMRIAVPEIWPQPDLGQPVVFHRQMFREGGNRIPICWTTGGKVTSVHADYRYGVPDVARMAGAVAGINGGFFQLAHVRDVSNAMLGPVMAGWTTARNEQLWDQTQVAEPARLLANGRFVPGSAHDNQRLIGRPLVLISPTAIRFLPFPGEMLNSRRAWQMILPDVTDAFVGGGWLVRDGEALSGSQMDIYATGDHADFRRRAFFGIDVHGRPVIGASPSSQKSEVIAECLQELGLGQAVLLDSGFSSSLYYNGSIFVSGHSDEKPSRPVPHILLIHRPDRPAAQAVGPAATKAEALVRTALDDNQSDYLPPDSRLVDQAPVNWFEERR